uniref:Uncharacterized protein n=1 Tax=Salix viminalis TaxID=40686 RepID=A0A6N2LBJ5_SALVM
MSLLESLTVALLNVAGISVPLVEARCRSLLKRQPSLLKVGEISEIVDTDSGAHIILRTG